MCRPLVKSVFQNSFSTSAAWGLQAHSLPVSSIRPLHRVIEHPLGPSAQPLLLVTMVFATQRRQNQASVLHGVVEIVDMHLAFKAVLAHVFKTVGSVTQQCHLTRAAHGTADGLQP